MNTQQALNWRYATKKFDETKKLSVEQINSLNDAARLTPTSYGLQPFRLIIVDDLAVREQLKAASWGQEQITSASQLLVFATIKNLGEKEINNYINLIAAERGLEVASLDNFKAMMLGSMEKLSNEQKTAWSQKQAYIALGFVMLAAAEMEIDTCPMEGFDVSQYDQILGLTDKGLTAAVVLPVGFRSADDQQVNYKKVRLPLEQFVV